MRLAMIISAVAVVAALLAMGVVWAVGAVGRATQGSAFGSLVGPDSWPAAVGFASMGLAGSAATLWVGLAVVAVVRETMRRRPAHCDIVGER